VTGKCNIFGDFSYHLGLKHIEIGDISIKSVGDFSIIFGDK